MVTKEVKRFMGKEYLLGSPGPVGLNSVLPVLEDVIIGHVVHDVLLREFLRAQRNSEDASPALYRPNSSEGMGDDEEVHITRPD